MSSPILVGIFFFLTIQFSYSLDCHFKLSENKDFFLIKNFENKPKNKDNQYNYFFINKGQKKLNFETITRSQIISSFEDDRNFLNLLYKNPDDYDYLQYDDNAKGKCLIPEEKCGKAKGILAWSNYRNQVVWFTHRYHNYLPKIGNEYQQFTSFLKNFDQKKKGSKQINFFCIHLKVEEIKKIFKHLFFINVNLYDKKLSSESQKMFENVENSFTYSDKKRNSYNFNLKPQNLLDWLNNSNRFGQLNEVNNLYGLKLKWLEISFNIKTQKMNLSNKSLVNILKNKFLNFNTSIDVLGETFDV